MRCPILVLVLTVPFAVAGRGQDAASAVTPATAPEVQPTPDPSLDLFARKCLSCHTLGKGVRVGPDLKGVLGRRDRAWVERLVTNPSAMLDSDAVARRLVTEFNGVRMPDLGLSGPEVASLLGLLDRCATEPCDPKGQFVPVTQATADDVARGRQLFLGYASLQGGAVPCLSCHTVRGSGAPIAGGTLARDLTNTYARLGDEGLDAALKSPAFPVMAKVFQSRPLTPEEAFALRAFLHAANASQPAPEERLSLPLVAGVVTVLVLVVLNAFWARRLRGVRRALTAVGR